MRQILMMLSTLALVLSSWGFALGAQDTQEVLARANQQFVLYENAKGDNSSEMYDHLYQSFTLYTSLLDAYGDPNAMEAARNRLTQIYPALKNAAMFFSNPEGLSKPTNYIPRLSTTPEYLPTRCRT